MSTRCFILEDQAPARRILESYLGKLSDFEVVGSAAAPSTAASILTNEPVDLLFLDLGLPQQDGFDFLLTLAEPPVVIVTTAYAARAVEGFTHGVADYLVKPFSFERFKIATERAVTALQARRHDTIIAIPTDRGHRELVATRNILSLTADGDYVQVRTNNQQLLTLGPLSQWAAKLPCPPFQRIHRSHVININHLDSIDTRSVQVGGEKLSVSSTYSAELRAAVDRRNAGSR